MREAGGGAYRTTLEPAETTGTHQATSRRGGRAAGGQAWPATQRGAECGFSIAAGPGR